jgi:hypothetical protein
MGSYLANNSGVTTAPAVLSNKSLSGPWGVAVQGTKLIVSDSGNNRVLVWNIIPTTNFAAADYVLGQSNFVTSTAAGGATCGNAGRTAGRAMSSPEGVYVDSDGHLYVADRGNHRILIYTSAITKTQQQANFVLGMGSLTGACPGAGTTTQSTLNTPSQVTVLGTKIYVADRANNRVLRFDKSTLADGMNADGIVGQINYTTNTAVACSAAGLNQPYGIWTDRGSNIYIGDYNQHRAVRHAASAFNSTPVNPAPSASSAIGQTNLTTCTQANSQAGGNNIIAGWAVNNSNPEAGVWVIHHTAHVIKKYDHMASNSNPPNANLLLGQLNYITNYERVGGIANNRLSRPAGVAQATAGGNTLLVISDNATNRVHLYDSAPIVNGASATRVLGQTSWAGVLANRGGSTASNTLNAPTGVWTNGNRLLVADGGNNRILGWRNWPTSDGQVADFVIGQTDMTTVTANAGSNRLSGPISMFASPVPGATADENYIWVADRGNHRVVAYQVLWRTTPLDPPAAAMSHFFILGQTSLTGNAAGTTQSGLNNPRGVWSDGDLTVVADTGNHRVLIWSDVDPNGALGPNANFVLGQPDFVSSTANNGGLSASSLNIPSSVWVDNGRLFVVDSGNHRILVWNSIPTMDNQTADRVIGQTNFLSNTFNGGLTYPTASLLYNPLLMWMDAGRMFITDGFVFGTPATQTNNRVLVIPSY